MGRRPARRVEQTRKAVRRGGAALIVAFACTIAYIILGWPILATLVYPLMGYVLINAGYLLGLRDAYPATVDSPEDPPVPDSGTP